MTTDAVLERLGEITERPGVWQRVNVDFIPVLSPVNWIYGRSSCGADPARPVGGVLPPCTGKSPYRLLKKFLEGRRYDLVIVHRERPDIFNLSVRHFGAGPDERHILISLLRDRGFSWRLERRSKLRRQRGETGL